MSLTQFAAVVHSDLGFTDPTRIRELYRPNLRLARAEGRKLKLAPAKVTLGKGGGRTFTLIDMETDFSDKGRLPVAGTFNDTERLISRLVRATVEEEITELVVTIDVHPPHTIHSDSWWIDDKGEFPDVTLPVRMALVDPTGKYPFIGKYVDGSEKPYRARLMSDYTVSQYAPHLKATGQGDIWVFADHCREGTDGVNLIPALAECIEWLCAARDIQPVYMYKGMIAHTDWFGPFAPCMPDPKHPQGGLQTRYLELFRKARRIDVTGEAEDFCVKNGMLQILGYYGDGKPENEEVLRKVNFITDCTSPIFADDPAKGSTPNADFRREMSAKGVRMITHDTPFATA